MDRQIVKFYFAYNSPFAETDGVFGFPFFVYAGQKFWGNDRVEWLVRAIQQKS
jgi:hypothetical protein